MRFTNQHLLTKEVIK